MNEEQVFHLGLIISLAALSITLAISLGCAAIAKVIRERQREKG